MIDHDTNSGIIYWDIPYENGTLEVIGFDAKGNEITRNSIQSSEKLYPLRIELDEVAHF